MWLFWIGLAIFVSLPVSLAVILIALHFSLRRNYLHWIVRIFQEKPLFVVPRGQPTPDAEDVTLKTIGGLSLKGCYLKTTRPRRGVILFGLEFGSNRWSCRPYCEHLLDAGYDVFAFEARNQGESDTQPGYDPLQWITNYEVEDTQAALAYLKGRADADPRGIGFFGISKGAGAGLLAASKDSYVLCFVTDGVFGTYSVLVPYMRSWYRIYNTRFVLQGLLPSWYYGQIGMVALRQIERDHGCRFPSLEKVMKHLTPRPLFMIHGEQDTYIKTPMARALFNFGGQPKEFWLVEGAKHNQALHVAGDEYRQRVLTFFNRHLASEPTAPVPDQNAGATGERGDPATVDRLADISQAS